MKPLSPAELEVLEREANTLIANFALPGSRTREITRTQESVRRLVEIGEPAVAQLIDGVLSDDQAVADYSRLTLNTMGPVARKAVVARFAGLDPGERWRLMDYMTRFEPQAARRFGASSLVSEDVEIRRTAIRHFGQHPYPPADSILIGRLDVEEPELRWDIIATLARSNAKQVAETLRLLLARDSWAMKGQGASAQQIAYGPYSNDGRMIIVKTLAQMDASSAAPDLLALLKEKGSGKAYMGREIIPLLRNWEYRPAIPELQAITESNSDEALKLLAAEALFRLGDRSGEEFMLKKLKDGSWSERRAVAEAIGSSGSSEHVAILVASLDDPDWGVVKAASCGLERITGTVNRSEGWADCSEHDAELWKAWYRERGAD